MNPFALFKPEYIYRPSQIWRRVRAAASPDTDAVCDVQLSFGGGIQVMANDAIGRALLHLGVYDLGVSEVLWRLTDAGDTVIDIGANIGYFTRLFGVRVGSAGKVIAFEPHPVLFEELRNNVSRHIGPTVPSYDLRHAAVSSGNGSIKLAIPLEFTINRGVCHVIEANEMTSERQTIEVESIRLDDAIAPGVPVGVVKIDVEGHESSVMSGAERILATHQVRDWVFEDLTEKSEVALAFERYGYEVFLVERRMGRPHLARKDTAGLAGRWEPPSFLATKASERALELCSSWGWHVLRRRSEE